jgi:hypothetical protein
MYEQSQEGGGEVAWFRLAMPSLVWTRCTSDGISNLHVRVFILHIFFLFECQHFGKGLRISCLLLLVTPSPAAPVLSAACCTPLWSACMWVLVSVLQD